jgi:carbamoyltransferase
MSWRESNKTPVLGRLYSDYLEARLGPSRRPEAPLEQKHNEIAASLQARLEEILFQELRNLYAHSEGKTLCLAGGVAFNCVANGKIFGHVPFEEIFVQPAAGDAGLALGAAFYVWHEVLGQSRCFQMTHASWGPAYSPSEISSAMNEKRLLENGFEIAELPEGRLIADVAHEIAEGRVVGWFSGRAEWGPRALGNRSILADPRRAEMTEILNRRIKHRESYRPFAPSILAESAEEFFESAHPSPFMTFAFPLRPEKREAIPAAMHVDRTCRVQTVERDHNPRYWSLIREFAKQTGIPALLNTSFNDNEPIVCAPGEAIDCFLRTHMDVLVMENYVIRKRHRANGKRSVEIASRQISEVAR